MILSRLKTSSKNQTFILKNKSSEFILSWVDSSSADRGYGDINENIPWPMGSNPKLRVHRSTGPVCDLELNNYFRPNVKINPACSKVVKATWLFTTIWMKLILNKMVDSIQNVLSLILIDFSVKIKLLRLKIMRSIQRSFFETNCLISKG